jgi:hypothetical protein
MPMRFGVAPIAPVGNQRFEEPERPLMIAMTNVNVVIGAGTRTEMTLNKSNRCRQRGMAL